MLSRKPCLIIFSRYFKRSNLLTQQFPVFIGDTFTLQNMPEYGFSMTRIFLYKYKTYNTVLIREYTGQRKPVYQRISTLFSLDRVIVSY